MTFRLFLSVFIFFSLGFLQEKAIAQNATLDTSFHSIGTFNNDVCDVYELPDGKLLVGGYFTRFRTTQQGGLVRLNADGTLDDSFNPNGHGITRDGSNVRKILVQADGKIIIVGGMISYNETQTTYGVARLNSDGTLDNSFNAGVGVNILGLEDALLQPDGKIVIVGQFTRFSGVVCKYIIRLNTDGSVDPSFNVSQGAGGIIRAVAMQADGKLIIGGDFNTVSGVTLKGLARLNTDGTLDNTFSIGTGAGYPSVYEITIQPNGKILVGGDFQGFNTSSNRSLIRLNSDGSIDTGFNCYLSSITSFIFRLDAIRMDSNGKILVKGLRPPYSSLPPSYNITRLNDDGSIDASFSYSSGIEAVEAIFVRSNGDVLVGGVFNAADGYIASNLILLHPDGSRDFNFLKEEGIINKLNSNFQKITIQKDQKILLSGQILTYGDKAIKNLIRLNNDGSQDASFQTSIGVTSSILQPIIMSTAQQRDEKIIVAGRFDGFGSYSVNNILRLNSDGSYDGSFNVGTGAYGIVANVVILPDDKILLAGGFTKFNEVNTNGLVRLNPDGSIDNSFVVGQGFNGTIKKAILQPDGKIIFMGSFTSYNGTSAPYIVRLKSDGTLDQTFYNRIPSFYSFYVDIAIQNDGKVLASVNGTGKIFRLNPDGSLDKTFNVTTADDRIDHIQLLPNGKIMIGGNFQLINGITTWKLARLNPNGTLDNSFAGRLNAVNGDCVMDMKLQQDGKLLVTGSFISYQNGTELPYKCNYMLRLNGSQSYTNTIRGNVYREDNLNCIKETTESKVSYAIIKADPGPFYGISDQYGNYAIATDTGQATYTLTKQRNDLQSITEELVCSTNPYTVPLTGAFKDTCCFDFAVQTSDCSLLNVTIGSASKRICTRSKTIVQYGNYGKAAASGVSVMVYYPKNLVPISSIPAWNTNQGDTLLIYTIGSLAGENEQHITIIDSVRCVNFTAGNTACVKAHISPQSDCSQANSLWDRSDMVVTAYCNQGTVQFSIRNNGNGDMEDSLTYRIYSNDTLIYKRQYKLHAGELLKGYFTSTGDAFRLEADQQAYHPGNTKEISIVEACRSQNVAVSAYQLGHVSSVSLNEKNFEEGVFCMTITGSHDPNDKSAFPVGRGDLHLIHSDDLLKYSIRFQNTGNDTAYTVRIIDTLDINLDVATLSDIIASHPYSIELSGLQRPVLVFNFYNINLPDSTRDKLGSQGFVSFTLSLKSSAMEGAQINNKAGIYFDYNDPVITNETLHKIDNGSEPINLAKGSAVHIDQLVTGIIEKESLENINYYPNPVSDQLTISFRKAGSYNLHILASDGVEVLNRKVSAAKVDWNVSFLKSGFYLLAVEDTDGNRTIKYFTKY